MNALLLVPRRLEEKHLHASRVMDNQDAKLWEDEMYTEEGKAEAVAAARDEKPSTALAAHPKSRAAPPAPPVSGKGEMGNED